ncbi:MAG: two-component sensor histidine kinase [Desulfobacterales bacterium]|nr:MAG: two-component sensor histidine kinase [Desulfobacterales bacterium]
MGVNKRTNPSPYAALRKVILASMILVPFIPFILVLAIGYINFTASLESNTIASMQRIVDDHRQMIESFLRERKSDLDFVLNTNTFEDLSQSPKLERILGYLQNVSNAFVDLGVFDEDGVHVAYQGPYELTGKQYKHTDWFTEVMKSGYYISDVFLGYRQVPHFIIAVAKVDGNPKWVLRATIDTQMFNRLVEKVRIGKTGEAYLLNADGIFQSDRRSGGMLMHQDPDYAKYAVFHQGIKTFLGTDATGKKYLYATTWLKDKNWLLVVRKEKADAFRALRSAAYLIVGIAVLGGAGIILIAFYLTGRIIGRMEQMDAEKSRLGRQLIQATRLAELGEMAAGFAHEINNPLQIIKSEQSLIEVLLSDLKEKGQLKESDELADLEDSIAQIQLQVNRCAGITQSILKFGRQAEPVAKDVDLQQFIPEVTGMVAKKASVHGIALEQRIADDTAPIHGDPGQLQQVLLNLYNNAIDAIVARHGSMGGRLMIETGPGENQHVEIRVTDNGCGISPENLKKVFAPFFTTKPVGKGTGLGLSVCYGIVESMGGVMSVASEEGVGTTFTVRLPAVVV